MKNTRAAYQILIRNSQRKIPYGKRRRKWYYNIKTNVKETENENVSRAQPSQDRVQR
jgi:hypothetical protein